MKNSTAMLIVSKDSEHIDSVHIFSSDAVLFILYKYFYLFIAFKFISGPPQSNKKRTKTNSCLFLFFAHITIGNNRFNYEAHTNFNPNFLIFTFYFQVYSYPFNVYHLLLLLMWPPNRLVFKQQSS